MKKLATSLVAFAFVAALAAPAFGASAGGNGHVTYDVQASISFTFSDDTAALGSLPANGTFTAEDGISYNVTSSDPWALTVTPSGIAANTAIEIRPNGNGVFDALSNGTVYNVVSGVPAGSFSRTDNYRARNTGGAASGSYNATVAYLATN